MPRYPSRNTTPACSQQTASEGLVSMAAAVGRWVLFDRLAREKEDYEAEEYTDPVEAAEDVDK